MQAYQDSRTVSCVLLYLAHAAGCLASSALGLHAVGFWLIFRIPCWYLSLLYTTAGLPPGTGTTQEIDHAEKSYQYAIAED
jgi:hypothetical protein